MGLGHMRRNMLLAEELRKSPGAPTVLLITGSRLAAKFELSPGIDVVTLPGLHKDRDAHYTARSLDLSLHALLAMRSAAISATIRTFEPDVLIVDNVPRGAGGELDATFADLRRHGRTKCVLGLRDVLDAPAEIAREWRKANNFATIRDTFDAVWIYGDQQVTDAATEYAFPADLAGRLRYTGFLDQRRRSTDESHTGADDTSLVDGRTILCLLGGGQDGSALAEAFVRTDIPAPYHGVLVTGPLMPANERAALSAAAASRDNIAVVEFLEDPAFAMRRSHAVITMGGYNTVCDVLSHGSRALVVPRVIPRQEQLIRATRLSARGLIDMLHPDEATPAALAQWMSSPDDARVRQSVHLHTPAGLHALLDDVLSQPSPVSQLRTPSHAETRHAS
jgi:predicted glycosyltransferase